MSVTCHFWVKFGKIVIGLATCSLAEPRAAPTRRTVASSAVGARPSSSRGAPHLAILRATSLGLASGNYPCGMVYTDNDGSRSARLARSRIERAAARSGSQAARKQMLQLSQTMREMRAPEPVSPSAASPPHKQARSNSPSSPLQSHPWGGSAASSTHSSRPKASRCRGCKGVFAGGGKCFSTRGGSRYHPSCFKCSDCGEDLRGTSETSGSGSGGSGSGSSSGSSGGSGTEGGAYYYEHADRVFCSSDFRVRYGRECGVCSTKLLKWLTRGGLAYCPHHESQQLPSCHSCDRLLPKPRPKPSGDGPDDPSALLCSPCVPESPPPPPPLALPDGRMACSKCASSAVDDTGLAADLYREIYAFFAEMGLQSACARSAAALALALVLSSHACILRPPSTPPSPSDPLCLTTSPRLLPTAML